MHTLHRQFLRLAKGGGEEVNQGTHSAPKSGKTGNLKIEKVNSSGFWFLAA